MTVNGDSYEVGVASHWTLLELLREGLGLTGTKDACNMGECGSCTVLLNGRPVLSCLILAVEANGKEITTIEGLRGGEGKLDPLQVAFQAHGAVQCGFCTPGMIMAGKALLEEHPDPTELEIKEALAGHYCRCTGYTKIFEAIRAAVMINKEGRE